MPRRRRRANGEGSVYRIKSRKLWAAAIQRVRPDGTRKTEVRYAKTQEAANELLRTMKLSGPAPTMGTGRVSFATTIQRYLATARIRPSTLDRYQSLANTHIIPALGMCQTSRLASETIQDFLNGMEDSGASTSSRSQALTVIRQACALAKREGVIVSNPAAEIRRPKAEPHEHRAWTLDESKRFLEILEEHDPPYRALFIAAIASGIREGELLAARLRDYDTKTGVLSIRRTVVQIGNDFKFGPPKTKSGRRSVVLPEFAAQAVTVHFAKRRFDCADDDDLLFPSRKKSPIRRNNLNRALKTLCDHAKLPRLRFHDLRHTSLSLLLQSGENPKVVQERAGHSRISVTLDTYAHVMPGMQTAAANRLNTMFGASEADGKNEPRIG